MSVHKDCGQPIRWAGREDDPSRFMPPLESAGQAYIIGEDGSAIMVSVYQIHNCDPDKVIAWLEYQRKLAAAKGESFTEMDNWAVAREQKREERWTAALQIDCPRCGSLAGTKCCDLAKKRRGIDSDTNNPHPARLEGFVGLD